MVQVSWGTGLRVVFLAAAMQAGCDYTTFTAFHNKNMKIAEKVFVGDVSLEEHQRLVKQHFKPCYNAVTDTTTYQLKC